MFRTISLIVASSLCLILAFPPFEIWPLVFIALVPVLLLIEGQSAGKAFRTTALTGLLFYLFMLYWFINMAWSASIPVFLSVTAWLLLCLYLSVYYGLFGAGAVYFSRIPHALRLFMLPAFWVVLEFIREHFLSGFGWLGLGYAPYRYLPLIQIADITGVFGISYLVVLVNLCLKEFIFKRGRPDRGFVRATMIGIVLIWAILIYGRVRLDAFRTDGHEQTTVTIVQPNIDQQRKWRPTSWPRIMDELLLLTRQAIRDGEEDLIIWPETSFPGYLWEDSGGFERMRSFILGIDKPLLFGIVTGRDQMIYNSAMLLLPTGQVAAQYDKRHLVPFGEFLPLRRFLPFLGAIIPVADFSPGESLTRFPVPGKPGRFFSAVICFEDTVARVVRGFVRNGTHLLVNLTNDAWFLDTHEPILHLQTAVFRAVENRRALVRAANTGISCVIAPTGSIQSRLSDSQGKETFVAGFMTARVGLWDGMTFYTRFGDLFSLLCLFGVGAGWLACKIHFNSIEH